MNKIVQILLILIILFSISLKGRTQIIEKKLPGKVVVLTFDDAVVSQYTIVAPLLKKYGFGATFFVCEFPPNFGDTTKYMSWQMIKELDEMGFEIGNHTKTHPGVADLTKEELLEEINYIEDKCGALKIKKPENFAYPGYSISKQVIDVLRDKGYKFGRVGGARVYDPKADYPLLVPSWATSDENKNEIMDALQKAENGKIVVLTIHGVPDAEHPWVTISPKLFEEYLKFLAENNYTVIALRDLKKYINVKKAFANLHPDFSKTLKN